MQPVKGIRNTANALNKFSAAPKGTQYLFAVTEEGAASPREEDTTRAMSDSMSAEATLAPSGVEMNRRMDICFSLKKEKI